MRTIRVYYMPAICICMIYREAFGVGEKEHIQIQSEVESVILDSVTNFNAVIKVKGTGTPLHYTACIHVYIMYVYV